MSAPSLKQRIPALAAFAAGVVAIAAWATSAADALPVFDDVPSGYTELYKPLVSDLEKRTFMFLWQTANPDNGLIPDRYPTPSFASIAAVGFGLTAYPIGVERRYITRGEAGAGARHAALPGPRAERARIF